MRKLNLLLLLLSSILSFSQNPLFDYNVKKLDETALIANYTLEFKEDSLNLDQSRKVEMLLFIGKNLSLFVGKKVYYDDIETRKITTREQFHEWAAKLATSGIYSPFFYRFYKNYPLGKMTCLDHIIAGQFKYMEDLNLFNWQLTGEIDTILNYKVQKATSNFGGRSWIAWFCPDIPYNDGPYKFNGLPGLILKVYDSRLHYVFELTSNEKPDQEIAIEFTEYNYIETTKEGFYRADDYAHKDIANRVKEMGNGIESQQKAARNAVKRNNPIELKRK